MRTLTLLLTLSIAAPAVVKVEKTAYKGWANCCRVTNGEVELVVTSDIGPRIIRFGFIGGQNLFKEFPEQLGKTGEAQFQLRGGHRVWKAPEDPVATWAPDNVPLQVEITADGLVTVIHRIANRSLFPPEFSVWAMSMMAQGGMAITGFPPRGHHPADLAATNPLVMWAYTGLSDKRWKFTGACTAAFSSRTSPAANSTA